MWGGIIEHIKRWFLTDVAPIHKLESLIDMKIGQPRAPKCDVCLIGYVRHIARLNGQPSMSSVEQRIDDKLCLPCLIRRELYEKAKLLLPRTTRRTMKPWPFRRRGEGVSEHHAGTMRCLRCVRCATLDLTYDG